LSNPGDSEEDQEFILEPGETLSPEEEEVAQLLEDDEVPADAGQAAHDEKVVKTLRDQAVDQMRAKGISITPAQNKAALGVFPKVRRACLGSFGATNCYSILFKGGWPC
jgi:hypothetical protein